MIKYLSYKKSLNKCPNTDAIRVGGACPNKMQSLILKQIVSQKKDAQTNWNMNVFRGPPLLCPYKLVGMIQSLIAKQIETHDTIIK
jgi:hypothetical protein